MARETYKQAYATAKQDLLQQLQKRDELEQKIRKLLNDGEPESVAETAAKLTREQEKFVLGLLGSSAVQKFEEGRKQDVPGADRRNASLRRGKPARGDAAAQYPDRQPGGRPGGSGAGPCGRP